MLWIALYLPQLPLDLAYRRWPEALRSSIHQTVPLVVTEAKRVGWANACAADAGIRPGMPEGSVQALAGDVVLVARDTASEADGVREAALWALHFTPQVSLMSQGILLEVSASLRLFGGREALVEQLRRGVLELGFTPQIASAPTATAAWLLAQYKDGLYGDGASFTELLESLPVNSLVSAQAHFDTLQSIGCQTIGQLQKLPRTGLTRRFGREMLGELDRAFGLEPEAHCWFEAPETFSARMELPGRVETTDGMAFAVRRLLLQMTGWLMARHAAVSRFSLRLHHEPLRHNKSATTEVVIALASASRDLSHLTLLMQEHLARVTLLNSVIEISLEAQDIVALAAPNTELFPTTASQAEAMERLIERLISRLGEEAIRQPELAADYRPEFSSIAIPVQQKVTQRRSRCGASDFPLRPTWLLRPPVPLLMRQNRPFYQSPLKFLAGPERIESGWWDDCLAVRDYYIVCNDNHLLLWVYQERHAYETESGWYLHGFFG